MAGINRSQCSVAYQWIGVIFLVCQLTYASCVVADNVSADAAKMPACLEMQRFQAGWMQSVELRSWDRIGSEKVLLADIAINPLADGTARFLAWFSQPDDIRGTRLLARVSERENEVFVYLPLLFKVRKITGRQLSNSVHGTDFSYEDLEWLLGMMNHRHSPRVDEQEIDGRSFYVVEVIPEPAQRSRYTSLVSYIEKDNCVLRRIDLFGPGKKKAKVLTVDPGSIREVEGIRLAHSYTMEDLREGTRTRLTVSNIRVDKALPGAAFEPDKLKEFHGFR